MAVLPSNLDLTISVPGSSFSPPLLHPSVRDLDINQIPVEAEEEWITASVEDGYLPRKKLRLTKKQYRLLEENFRFPHSLNPKQKEALAMQLQLKPRQVEVWFQNRRARNKFKQTEIKCEYLKKRFGSLTEQNRRLQKEVEELRAMKVGPPTVLSPHSSEPLPASTLAMCPRCESITTTVTTTVTAISSKVETLSLQLRPSSAAF